MRARTRTHQNVADTFLLDIAGIIMILSASTRTFVGLQLRILADGNTHRGWETPLIYLCPSKAVLQHLAAWSLVK